MRRAGGLPWSAMFLFVASVLAMLASTRRASADQTGGHTIPVTVLALDSDDAEEQADAFTGALRSRIRAAQAWSLVETTHSLGMLTAALKCPSRPTPECQQRIADQLKAERYVWGFVTKGPQPGQVTAELHLYQRSKPDTVVRENYADNLKDQNDDTLRKIAQRVLERLGANTVGVVVVRAPADMNGEVVVDGDKRVPLQAGSARLELGPGSHSVEVIPNGGASTKRNVLVTSGKESLVEVAPPPPPESAKDMGKPFPTKKVVGGASVAVGVGLAALAVQQALFHSELQDRGKRLATLVPAGQAPCAPGGNKEFCDTDNKAKTASGIAIGAASLSVVALGAGIYLLFIASDATAPERAATTTKTKTRITPLFGTNGGGFAVSGTF